MIVKELKENKTIYWHVKDIKPTEVETSFFDLPTAFSDIMDKVKKEKQNGNIITLSIASGTKIVAFAMYLVGLLTDSETIYVIPKKYNLPKLDEAAKLITRTSETQEVYKFPRFPIKILDKIPMELLKEFEKVEEIKGATKEKTDSERVKWSNKKDILVQHGCLEEKKVGRERVIKITLKGKEWLKIGKALE